MLSFPWNRILGIGEAGQECKTLKNRGWIPYLWPVHGEVGLLSDRGTLVDWQMAQREGEQCMSQSTGMLLAHSNRTFHWNLCPHSYYFLPPWTCHLSTRCGTRPWVFMHMLKADANKMWISFIKKEKPEHFQPVVLIVSCKCTSPH